MASDRRLAGVPPLRELIRRAEAAGLDVRISGGDYVIRVPGRRVLRVNSRRKDGTPELTKLVWIVEGERA